MKQQLLRSLIMTIGLFVPIGMVNINAAQALSLGPAQGYNLFVLGDVAQDTIHAQGKVAVGHNITSLPFPGNPSGTYGSYGIAQNSVFGDNLIVGNNINLGTNGQVNGKAIYGGTVANVNATGGVTQGSPINFTAAKTYLTALSQSLGNLLTTGTVSAADSGGNIQLTDNSLLDYKVFNIAGSQLTNSVRYNLGSIPITSTIIINISGDNLNLGNGNFEFQGIDSRISKILYNFRDATTLTARNIGFKGSILAPNANFNADNGQILGTGIFANVQDITGVGGTFEYNSTPFDSNLPGSGNDPATNVPTPALLPGLLGMGLQTWRKRRQQAAA